MFKHNGKFISETRINRENHTIKYPLEYTLKDEPIKDDFSNLKKIDCVDLEHLILCMFELRQTGCFNVNIGLQEEDKNGWILEDYCNDTEQYSASDSELKLKKSNRTISESMEEMQKELDMYRSFIKKYNSEKMFKEYQKEQNTFTYYYRLRPPSIGCQPSKDLISMTDKSIVYNNRTYHGTCNYSRELSDKELNEYDLDKE